MAAFEKENQSKSKNNNISSIQFLLVLKFFYLLLSLFFFCKTVVINDNGSLVCPQTFSRNWAFRVLTGRGTNQAVLSKMGDFQVEIIVLDDFCQVFIRIFTCLKLCMRILIQDDTVMMVLLHPGSSS